jgi:predicted metallo-beta-lactamase superfamily hydrolase
MYTHYVNNYNKALVVYQHCRREPKFREFLDQIKAKQEKRSLDLADLLITPVQRVPRYLLLLKVCQL